MYYVIYLFTGISNWANKTVVRAIPLPTYKTWRPEMWGVIKKDYVIIDSDSDSESDDLPVFPAPETDDLPVFPLPQLNEFQLPEETPTPTSASNNADFSSELGSIKLELAKINEHITQVNNQKLEAIKDCFKCSVCLEIKFTSFVFCLECKRLIGCADCITNNLDRCPLCRGPFSTQCASCDEVVPLPPVPMVIPGLQNAMEQAENQ